jgi:hypothetical protein
MAPKQRTPFRGIFFSWFVGGFAVWITLSPFSRADACPGPSYTGCTDACDLVLSWEGCDYTEYCYTPIVEPCYLREYAVLGYGEEYCLNPCGYLQDWTCGCYSGEVMKNHRSVHAAVACGIGAACVLGLFITASVNARQGSTEEIRPPSQWLPMTYEYTITSKNGTQRYIEYRSTRGDLRRDGLDIDEIQITNVAQNKFYRGHHGEWTESPMRPQPADGKPFLRLKRDTVTEVQSSDPRVQGVTASVGIPVSFYEFRAGTTSTVIYAPELNMLEVWARHENSNGFKERKVSNVIVGEPQIAFTPLSGVPVKRSTDPAGPGRISLDEVLRSRTVR